MFAFKNFGDSRSICRTSKRSSNTLSRGRSLRIFSTQYVSRHSKQFRNLKNDEPTKFASTTSDFRGENIDYIPILSIRRVVFAKIRKLCSTGVSSKQNPCKTSNKERSHFRARVKKPLHLREGENVPFSV